MKSVYALLFVCSLSCVSPGQNFRQLTANTGWLATNHELFWTTSNGRAWKNITPPQISGGKQISAVFFKNTASGWAVLARDEENDEQVPVRFWLVSTDNAGATWSSHRIVPSSWQHLPEGMQLNIAIDSVSIHFWDEQHGIVAIEGNFMLTSDGGRTWRDANSPGFGSVVFTTPNDGWVRGESARFDYSGQLFVTHDGSKSWRRVLLPGPGPNNANSFYGVPVFQDPEHGFLTVQYSGPGIESTALFSSKDGGRTWKRDAVLQRSGADHDIVTVAGLEWRTLRLKERRIILSWPLTSSSVTSSLVDLNLAHLVGATFVDKVHGWVLTGVQEGLSPQLLSTSDSGARWQLITPATGGVLTGQRAPR